MEKSWNKFAPRDIHWLKGMGAVKGRVGILDRAFWRVKVKQGHVDVWRTERGNYVARAEGPWGLTFESQPARFLKKAFKDAVEGALQKNRPVVEMTEALDKIKEACE